MKLKITISTKEFIATLNENEACEEFVKLLPMEVDMAEHNGNEKYFNLSVNIPGRSVKQDRIEVGDLMIWSSNTFVIFYDNFSSSYSYIKIGEIDNTSGLRQALGKGNVKVKIEIATSETTK